MRKVRSVEDLVPETAILTISREQRELQRRFILYATFGFEGECRYVGKSCHGVARPFGPHHAIDPDAEWDTLRVWQVDAEDDAALCRLEQAAIAAFEPKVNVHGGSGSPRRKEPHYKLIPAEFYKAYTVEAVAEMLSVPPSFIIGEMMAGRLASRVLQRPRQLKPIIRIWADDVNRYVEEHWTDVTEHDIPSGVAT